ncbi:MAG: efflux RND transporter permease subunit [Actinomycetota bacterium]|jgi:CzcA family heavy metal efflux pump
MMRAIVAASLRFRFLIVALAAALMFIGVGQVKKMPVDVFPEFAPPTVEIQTLGIGLAPADIENLITVPLEEVLAGTPGLDVMRSRSVNDLSQIRLIFDRDTDLIHARQLVQERLDLVAPNLPTWAAPPVMLQPLSATSRAMKIGIRSDSLNLMQQSMIAYWTIKQRLLQVPGVANAPIWGERIQMLSVQADRERMKAHGVSLDEVMTTTADALEAGLLQFSEGSIIGTGGFLEGSNERLNIRHRLPIKSVEDLAQVPLVRKDGTPIKLADVANVIETGPPMVGDAVIGVGKPGEGFKPGPGLMMIVEKLPWANTLDVTRGVEEAIEALKPGLPGLEIDTAIFRPASFIETSLKNLSNSLLIGCLLMIFMLFVFLYSWRVALISVVAIPLSLLAAAMVLNWRGTTVNTMILAGFAIALGDVVDDAIIDIENVVRRLREHRREGRTGSTAGVILHASLEVRGAIVYATLIEVVAVIPIFFLEGLSGAFFRPLVTSYAIALLVSMAVALTVTPALALIFLHRSKLESKESPLAVWLQRGYGWLLARVLPKGRYAFASVAALVLIALSVVPNLGQSLLPDFKERDFLMHFLTKPGTSLGEEVRVTEASAVELAAIPGILNFGAHIGQAYHSDEPVGPEFGENWVSVDPKADYDETVGKIQAVMDDYPGLITDVQTYLKERIREVLAGSSHPIVIRIQGPDLEVLRSKAKELSAALQEIPGLSHPKVENQAEMAQIQIQTDLAAAQRVGLKPGDIRRAASTLVNGEEVGDIFRDGKAYDIPVWSPAENRDSVDDIRNLQIDTPSGQIVKLSDVASVQLKPSPNVVKHEDLYRKIDVEADLTGERDLGSAVKDVEQALKTVDLPREYTATMLGEHQERQAANKKLQNLAIVAAIGVFFLLQASFLSFRLAMLAFLTLPMAVVGGALAAYLGDGIISLGSMVGFLTVIGIVARNGIMMISHFQHLENVEGVPFGPALVLRGAKERVVPVMMTVLTTGLVLVPLIVAGSIPGHEIEHPMAVVILGGLITSTLLNLFVVPSLYLRFGKSRKARAALQPAGA